MVTKVVSKVSVNDAKVCGGLIGSANNEGTGSAAGEVFCEAQLLSSKHRRIVMSTKHNLLDVKAFPTPTSRRDIWIIIFYIS